MGRGNLQVEVHTADDALPIANANVLIKDPFGRVLHNLTTDSSGNTRSVDLYAADKFHTLNPNDPGPDYGIYDVEIRKNNYITEIIRGVQIFDGINSILPINLQPNPTPTQEVIDTVYIPPNNLRSTAPRRQDAPLGELNAAYEGGTRNDYRYIPDNGLYYTRQTRVLNEVIIPDYITVHLGTPASAARNVRVKFTDYIKNVASSEIYPTWPENSLRANIYAIITFALNRIYTEWYRSRGYNFDITNSTTVDQAYVENRDIFQNISNIVDNIFNSYVRRIGLKEPFFTQFCNGTTVTCRGLSQWGTVTLANQGMTPLQILRHYYPNDVDIVTTNNIAGITESYPGSPLKQGSQGRDVQIMQNYLNRIRANYPAIPVIPNPNGVFGPETTDAVKAFQKTFYLLQDGVIGKNTWYRIIQMFVGIARLADLESEGIRIGIGLTPPTTVVREGSKGADVIQLQFILNFLSQFYPDIPPVIQDGTFGKTTRDSVLSFQKRFGLTQDGIVGSATWRMLYQVYRSAENSATTPPSGPPAFPGVLLRIGSRGDSVLLMQKYLNMISSRHPNIPRLVEDGIFGPMTDNAVRIFQREFGLTPDGIIGPLTWNAIVNMVF